MKQWLDFFKQVLQEWNEDKVTRLAASLAYYTVLALAPLLVVVIAVAGLFFGADVAQQQIVAQTQSLVGVEGAQLINTLLTNARQMDTNLVATLLGSVAIILGATGVVGELKDSLNTIWNVAPKPGKGLFATFTERVLSFGMVLGIGFMLMVSLVISAILELLGTNLRSYFQEWVVVAQGLDVLFSFLAITVMFALLFKFLPDVHLAWRDVWVGAAVTALLFTLGKYAIGLYLGNSNIATPFGAAGSLVILFVWVYYAAQILFLGAEITQVYAYTYGSGIRARSNAITLTDAARVEQGTKAPAEAPAPPADATKQPVPAPLYLQLAQPDYQAQGPFNPLQLVGAAIGVHLFGWAHRLLDAGKPRPHHSH